MSDMNTTKPKRPPQTRTGLTDTGVKKAADKSARTRAREFALQALYQHLVGRNEAESIDAFTRDLVGFHKADSAHYDALLHYEFKHCLDVPYRVVINECIELAKAFGGTDGHKYVNGVLHKLAPGFRAAEVAADQKA